MYARQVKSIGPRGYNEIRNGLLDPPLWGHALLTLVGRIRQITIAPTHTLYAQFPHPSTVCTHNLAPTHSLCTPC
jgi:hypothetical protein